MEAGLVVLIVGPMVLAVAASIGGVVLLRRRRRPDGTLSVATVVFATLLLVAALGVFSCYGVVFTMH